MMWDVDNSAGLVLHTTANRIQTTCQEIWGWGDEEQVGAGLGLEEVRHDDCRCSVVILLRVSGEELFWIPLHTPVLCTVLPHSRYSGMLLNG